MSKKPVAGSAPTAPTNVQKEYVLKVGKQGVFSNGSEAVVRARHAKHVDADHANGTEKEYKLYERIVTFDGDSVPTGEDSQGARGDVKEKEIAL